MARCKGCHKKITFPHPLHQDWDEGCYNAANPDDEQRWIAIFYCKMCKARVWEEGSVTGVATCHIFKTTRTHECDDNSVGILEQVGARLAPRKDL